MKYKKKPVVIDAIIFEYSSKGLAELKLFCGDMLGFTKKARCMDAIGEAQILTLEDGDVLKVAHIATEGDYIIKGVEGEFYPCKPDIFKKTYEKVES